MTRYQNLSLKNRQTENNCNIQNLRDRQSYNSNINKKHQQEQTYMMNANSTSSDDQKHTSVKTPTRNNYAAPHTPIASAKRPSSYANRGQSQQTSNGLTYPTVSTPLAMKTINEKEHINRVSVTHASTLSPMHPMRPVTTRSEAEQAVNHEGYTNGEECGKSSTTWGSLFSPVLSFLNNNESSTEQEYSYQPDVRQSTHDNDDHNNGSVDKYNDKQIDYNKIESSVPTVIPAQDYGKGNETHQPDHYGDTHETYPTAHHAHDYDYNVEVPSEYSQEEDIEEEEEEEEFNPYLFIKRLPPYSTVCGHHNIILTPENSRVLENNNNAALAYSPLTHHLRHPYYHLPPKAPIKAEKDKTLVLDLDETLVHCTVENPTDSYQIDMTFPVNFHGIEYQVHVKLRPYLKEFLESVSQRFEVVVFTASQRVYADELLNRIDPENKYIKHRMFRESCLPVEGNYLKDLNVLGRDLSKSMLVDNSPHAFGYQIDNGIPIESWFDDPNDTELLKLDLFLKNLLEADDVRPIIREKFQTYKLIENA